MIILPIDTVQNFTNKGGSIQFRAYFPDAEYIYATKTTGGSWLTVSEYSDVQDEVDYTITVAENTGTSSKAGTVTIKYRDFDDYIYETTIYIYQSYFQQFPIWLDTYYTGDSSVASYSIILDGEEIYKGEA